MSVQRRKYDPDFERNAVPLTEEPGRTVIEVAENLGISKALLYKWRREFRLVRTLGETGWLKTLATTLRLFAKQWLFLTRSSNLCNRNV